MRPLMSLLDTFRSWPTGPFKLDISRRWMSGLRFRLPSARVSRRNPELIPAMAAIVLALAAVLQVVVPSGTTLPPDRPRVAPRQTAAADPVPAVRAYPAVMSHPIF